MQIRTGPETQKYRPANGRKKGNHAGSRTAEWNPKHHGRTKGLVTAASAVAVSFPVETLTDHGNVSGSVTVDYATSPGHRYVLTNATTFTFSGATNGNLCDLTLYLVQDGTGGRTISFGSYYKAPGGLPSLSTTAAAIDCLYITIESATEFSVDYGRGYSA